MLQSELSSIPIDYWISYSGHDKWSVEAIYRHMVEINNAGGFKGVKLNPKKYQWKLNGGNWDYELDIGQDIGELIHVISNNVLRTVVLSKDYFKSPVCMQELCMCLCSDHISQHVYPLVQLVDFEDPENVLTTDKFEFVIPTKPEDSKHQNRYFTNIQDQTLAEALYQTHEYIRQSSKNTWQGYEFKPLSVEYFQSTLEKLAFKVFATNQQQEKDLAKAFFIFASRMANLTDLQRFDEVTNDMLTQLYKRKPIRDLAKKMELNTKDEFLEQIKGIRSELKVKALLEDIAIQIIDYPELCKDDFKVKVYQFAFICMLKCQKSLYLMLYKKYRDTGSLYYINANTEEPEHLRNSMFAAFVMSIAYGVPPSIDITSVGQFNDINKWKMENLLTVSSRSPSGNKERNDQEHAKNILWDFGLKLLPQFEGGRPHTYQGFIENDEYRDLLRNVLAKPEHSKDLYGLLLSNVADRKNEE